MSTQDISKSYYIMLTKILIKRLEVANLVFQYTLWFGILQVIKTYWSANYQKSIKLHTDEEWYFSCLHPYLHLSNYLAIWNKMKSHIFNSGSCENQ